jgi:hypothetical protein
LLAGLVGLYPVFYDDVRAHQVLLRDVVEAE